MLSNIVDLEHFWITDSKVECEFVEQIIYAACDNETLKNIYFDIPNLLPGKAGALVSRIKRIRPDVDVYINGVSHIPSSVVSAVGNDSETESEDDSLEPVKRLRRDSETESENEELLSAPATVGSDTESEAEPK